MRKKQKRVLKVGVLLAVLALCMQVTMPAFAYFQRGDVKIKAGKQSVSLEQGGSESVSVTLTPSSSQQLPGCGMAECPQSCGEKECLDANGECTCNGTTYQTYYAYASAASSNTSVATAKYDNGTVSIKGVGPGTATITLTASLRQFTSTSTTIQVIVSAKNNGGNSGNNGNSNTGNNNNGSQNIGNNNNGQNHNGSSSNTNNSTASNGNGNNTSGVTAKAVDGNQNNNNTTTSNSTDTTTDGQNADGQNTNAQNPEGQDGITTINSDRGPITFVPITDGMQGKDQLAAVMGQEAYVDFQKKDDAGTVLYAWEFYGKDLIAAEDMNYGITTSTTAFEGCEYGSSADSLYMAFAQEGGFPGKASVFVKVNDQFSDDKELNLYRYLANGNAEMVTEGLKIENGYVTMELDQGGNYILTTQKLVEKNHVEDTGSATAEMTSLDHSKNGVNPAVIVVVIIVVVIVIAAILLVLKKKKGADPVKDGTAANIPETAAVNVPENEVVEETIPEAEETVLEEKTEDDSPVQTTEDSEATTESEDNGKDE